MNIKECVDFINFWIRKERGAFYTIEESVSVIDRGQIAYYNDVMPKYAASQIIKDTLLPFRETYTFTTVPSIPQLVTIPEQFLLFVRATTAPSSGTTITMATTAGIEIGNVVVVTSGVGQFHPNTKVTKILSTSTFEVDIAPITTIGTGDAISFYDEKLYLDLLGVNIQFSDNGGDRYFPVKMTNEDEISDKLNSQINPPSQTAPVGQMVASATIQLFPSNKVYTGFITYMRRPKKPVYGYSIVGGRSIVYDPSNSVQLEWKDTDINFILLKGLASIGINLSDQEVSQFAELKSAENYQGVNHL